MVIEILKKIGLTDNEIVVYLALLEICSSTTGEIIKKSNLHSSRVYECLEKLQVKGLVSYVVKANRKYFEATNPNRLIDYLEERRKQIEQEKSEVKKIIPDLVAKGKVTKQVQEANIYSGYKGIRALLENLLEDLKKGGEYYVFGAEGGMKELLGSYFYLYQKQKSKLKIKSKVIFGDKARNTDLLDEFKGEARFISSEFSSPTDTFIYNNKVIIFVWNENPAFAILIKNKSIYQSYKSYFSLLWKLAKK
ncbi:MAG: helix-turn-helix domain-containing protein [Candidatus Nanoarchaeia archaeon]|nr:helix-turn-helix domain-containing protein [Candidatus Nanoarchaeia archaeon]MDD5741081.1 helix-turn-helix domain-containing protein [Candidatus Nanoarchaeia archaeon]